MPQFFCTCLLMFCRGFGASILDRHCQAASYPCKLLLCLLRFIVALWLFQPQATSSFRDRTAALTATVQQHPDTESNATKGKEYGTTDEETQLALLLRPIPSEGERPLAVHWGERPQEGTERTGSARGPGSKRMVHRGAARPPNRHG